MKIYDSARLKHLTLLIIGGIVLVPTVTWGLNTVATGFRATATTSELRAYGECYGIRRTGTVDYFIPTKTAAEFQAFKNNKPSAVALTDCPSTDLFIRQNHRGNTTTTTVIIPRSKDELFAGADIHCNAYDSTPYQYASRNTGYVGDGQRSGIEYNPSRTNAAGDLNWFPLKYLTETSDLIYRAHESIGCTNDAQIEVGLRNVSVTTSCGADGQGKLVGGYCWYLANVNQSCNAACSTGGRGGCNLAGTRNYVGSSGTLDNCATVLGHLGRYSNQYADSTNSSYQNVGCAISVGASSGVTANVPARRYTNGATSCGATGGSYHRACACNNS